MLSGAPAISGGIVVLAVSPVSSNHVTANDFVFLPDLLLPPDFPALLFDGFRVWGVGKVSKI